jgi:hypothetical protein
MYHWCCFGILAFYFYVLLVLFWHSGILFLCFIWFVFANGNGSADLTGIVYMNDWYFMFHGCRFVYPDYIIFWYSSIIISSQNDKATPVKHENRISECQSNTSET